MTTLIWQDTFESYAAGSPITAPWTATTQTVISNSIFKFGTQSLGVGTGGFGADTERLLGSSNTVWTADFYAYMPSGTTVPDPPVSNSPALIGYIDGTGTNGVWIQIGGAGSINVGTIAHIGTWMTSAISLNAWHRITLGVTMAVSGSATLIVDGVTQHYSGDTVATGGQTFIDSVICQGQFVGGSPTAELYFDNLTMYSGLFNPSAATPFFHMIPAGMAAEATDGLFTGPISASAAALIAASAKLRRLLRKNPVVRRREILKRFMDE